MKTVKLIVSLIFGLGFIVFGLNKFVSIMPTPKDLTQAQMDMFGHFMAIKWLMPLVGIAEIVGGLLFILPKTRALGAIVILPVMAGIMLHNVVVDQSGLPIALGFFVINIWMILDNISKYKPMIK